MPPPRLGRSPGGEIDNALFSGDDPYGWNVSEIEEEYELKPGLEHLAQLIVSVLAGLGRGAPEPRLAGHAGRSLAGNPYWPPELAALAGKLGHERYVVLLPLALSRTQDDKGLVRWTFFGSSEQGPERAFWRSFLSAPGRETAERDALGFFSGLLSRVYGEKSREPSSLHSLGFRILPSVPDPLFPFWTEDPLPSWTRPFLVDDSAPFEDVRYLLTFRPFCELPGEARSQYASGRLALLPFPGSLVFWGQADRLLKSLPLAAQLPLQKLAPRSESPGRLRVPQSGWLHEPGSEGRAAEIHPDLLVNTYHRTSRWDRVLRSAEEAAGALGDKVARVLFSTAPDDMGLYGKPMARNCQIWSADARLVLDGPRATRDQIAAAEAKISRGGLFRYRFQFPAMRVGRREVYWQRPLAAYWEEKTGRAEILDNAPLGCLTAYDADAPDPAEAEFLWPRLSRRGPYLAALLKFARSAEHYAHQTALNIVSLLDAYGWRLDQPLPRGFARSLLRLPENETLEEWLAGLPDKAEDRGTGEWIREELEKRLDPPAATAAGARPEPPPAEPPAPALTFGATATRAFEEEFWRDIFFLSHGKFANTENADCYQDPRTLSELAHRRRDLEALGDYLFGRHAQAIADAGLEGKAVCGEIPFRWETDFSYDFYGGWKNDQDGRSYERDLLVIIPGKNRQEAIVLADHYDTAYMEDRYDRKRGGDLLRIASSGADDNHSATAALLQAAPIFLRLAKDGRLERDVWLLHLTGEEFPADSLGARQFVRTLVEGTLRLRQVGGDPKDLDLARVRVRGVFVMDMIAHNRNGEKDVFQISPGRSASSFALAELAHRANRDWNALAEEWNRGPDRRGRGPGQRSADGLRIPSIALHPRLRGEVRTSDDPQSSLYNTDGQIFSDAGVPVVLFMENYDINRQGYHDSHDTMENIDLDYGAAVAAIAIEAVARAAAAARLD